MRDVKFDASMADCRDETDETQLLNGSFEESDLAPDFIDCWHIVRGSAKRTAGDAHHGSYAMRLSSGAELAYAAPNAAAVAVREGEAHRGSFGREHNRARHGCLHGRSGGERHVPVPDTVTRHYVQHHSY